MPELPEVQTVVNGLRPVVVNKCIQVVNFRRANLRYPLTTELKNALEGSVIREISRRAKYICLYSDQFPNHIVLWHLGMSGQVIIFEEDRVPKEFDRHDHVVLTTHDKYQIRFRDPRRFGFLTLVDQEDFQKTNKLGPDPFSKEFHADYLKETFSSRRANVKALLLDQKVVGGLGNIYVLEALHAAHLSPYRCSSSLTHKECHALVLSIHDVLKRALESGGSSLRDHVQTNGEMGYFQHQFKVYGRECEACLSCSKGKIHRQMQQGRSSFFCPTCQR